MRRVPGFPRRFKGENTCLATDCYCGLAVFAGNLTNFWQPYLKNYNANPLRSGWEVENTWLDK